MSENRTGMIGAQRAEYKGEKFHENFHEEKLEFSSNPQLLVL